MKNNNNGYMIFYKDDLNHKHLTFVKEKNDVSFYRKRYFDVTVEYCDYSNRKEGVNKAYNKFIS